MRYTVSRHSTVDLGSIVDTLIPVQKDRNVLFSFLSSFDIHEKTCQFAVNCKTTQKPFIFTGILRGNDTKLLLICYLSIYKQECPEEKEGRAVFLAQNNIIRRFLALISELSNTLFAKILQEWRPLYVRVTWRR